MIKMSEKWYIAKEIYNLTQSEYGLDRKVVDDVEKYVERDR